MKNMTIDYKNASVQVSSFSKDGGVSEYHMMVHVSGEGTFRQQVDALHAAFDAAVVQECGGARPVFVRYFLSDVANQSETLDRMLDGRWECAVSTVGQPPLDGSKITMWAYLVSCEAPSERDGLWAFDYLGHKHLWMGNGFGIGPDSEQQTYMIMDKFADALASEGCDIPNHCLRTWFFVHDVDHNYAGVVKGRRERFDSMGLTKETHYLASTGIAGNNPVCGSYVALDAYAAAGMPAEKVTYLKGATHLNPTHEYGVTFERGTAVDYDDRRHVIISGTASIDNKGQIVHPGDIRLQTLRMWENVEVLLAEAGASYGDVMHMIVYLRDVADYACVRAMYEERFPDHPKVFVWAPVCRPGWLIEMECIAVCHPERSEGSL